jgi:HSP20 family protein
MNIQQQHQQQQTPARASGASANPAPNAMAAPTGQPGATVLPPVDIFEDENGFVLLADMPGVAKEQLVVRVTGDSLLIEGTAAVPVNGDMELVYGEARTAQYRRSFTLSRELDPGKIEARLDKGVLTLRIPKAEEARPRRIEVSVG